MPDVCIYFQKTCDLCSVPEPVNTVGRFVPRRSGSGRASPRTPERGGPRRPAGQEGPITVLPFLCVFSYLVVCCPLHVFSNPGREATLCVIPSCVPPPRHSVFHAVSLPPCACSILPGPSVCAFHSPTLCVPTVSLPPPHLVCPLLCVSQPCVFHHPARVTSPVCHASALPFQVAGT